MKRWVLILSLILLFSINSVSYAGEFGTNGLITMPTADVLVPTHLDLGYHRTFVAESEDLISFNYGVKEGVQIGGRTTWYQQSKDFKFYPGLKVNLLSEKGNYQPLLAVGISGWEDNFYLVASKMIPAYSFRIHVGVGDKGIFNKYAGVGVSKILNPVVISTGENSVQMPRVTVQAEYNNSFNLGSEFRFGSGIELHLGVIDFEQLKLGIGFENEF